MDLLQGLIVITSIHLLAAASPGPDFVLVSQQTLSNGKKAGLMCSIGIALGLAIHIVYSSLGLATVIANSANALWVIKILGGGYLLYLGVQGLRSRPTSGQELVAQTAVKYSARKGIGVGFLCNALNPKAPIYFVSLFTVVLSPDMPLYQLAIYGGWMMLIQLAWFSTVVMLLSRPAVNAQFKKCGHWLERILGGAMIALGLKVIATRTG
ncbi:LysE family translocator [Denitrificimonas caeni]|uniref:LysE family transporter n=1 Tax=Denitrificimonas caeni TaxID=521720 RepID=A0AAE9VQ54_9GAMM|nr:LysE family transporter [Denitrificimonas caeni]NLJ13558.1 LysE family transporter [Gammaproteobacteria bacterium]WBE26325.1 LysE family transporter [Denitrificimonas caeni]